MELTQELKDAGFALSGVFPSDLNDFIDIEKISHYKYVAEHSWFFGEWNEKIPAESFYIKLNSSFFKKLTLNGSTVGFFGYDEQDNRIKDVFIRISPRVQNNGIGTLFLKNLTELSEKSEIPIFLAAIKTNPAQNLYMRMGFKCCKEDDVFRYFSYQPHKT